MPHLSIDDGLRVGHVEAAPMTSKTVLGAVVHVGSRLESEQPRTWVPVIVDAGATEPLWVGDGVYQSAAEADRAARVHCNESIRKARVALFA